MICFVDVSSLKRKGKDQREFNHLDLGSLEEKEVIVIKDNKRNNPNNTEGAVCLFKQGSSEELNVVGWLASDLQKYAIGFQHALTPAAGSRKGGSPYTISSDKLSCSNLQKGTEEPSYVNKLCSLVVQKARQELKNTLENSSKSLMRQSSSSCSSDSKPATPNHEPHDSCSEKPWSMDLHAKDIFGMALKMIQQHLVEKSRQTSHEINASPPNYAQREPSYERVGQSQSQSQAHKHTGTGSASSQETNQEQPKASISGILLSLVQKVLRDATSSLEEGFCDSNRAHKQAPTS